MFSKYACCVMEKFASSRREGCFFSLVALQYLLKLPTTHARTADGSRGSASGLPVSSFLICCRVHLAASFGFPVHENYLCTDAEIICNYLPLP